MRKLRIPDDDEPKTYQDLAPRIQYLEMEMDGHLPHPALRSPLAFDDEPGGQPYPLEKFEEVRAALARQRPGSMSWWLRMGIESGLLPLPRTVVEAFVQRCFRRPLSMEWYSAKEIHDALRHAPLEREDPVLNQPREPKTLFQEYRVPLISSNDYAELARQGSESNNADTIASVLKTMAAEGKLDVSGGDEPRYRVSSQERMKSSSER